MLSISIVITTYNDAYYLKKILIDILNQDYEKELIELIIIEAGKNEKEEIESIFKNSKINLKYIHKFKMNRSAALNLGFKKAKKDLIVRLDARTHIKKDYLRQLSKLSNETGASNVGGVKVPIGETPTQKFIARLMQNPFCLGGAKFRKTDFEGLADTVYLGCYRRDYIQGKTEFDEKLIRISEDADLNFSLINQGGKIYVSSKIKAYYYPRENIKKFFLLMFNYGVSRGLFILKNKTITSYRQIILPISFISVICFLLLSLFIKFFLYVVLILIFSYNFLIFSGSLKSEFKQIKYIFLSYFCLMGTHIAWTIGIFYSYILFKNYKN